MRLQLPVMLLLRLWWHGTNYELHVRGIVRTLSYGCDVAVVVAMQQTVKVYVISLSSHQLHDADIFGLSPAQTIKAEEKNLQA